MTHTLKTEKTNNIVISIKAEGTLIIVDAHSVNNDNMEVYKLNECIYHHTEINKAKATYNRYKRMYK